MTCKKLVVALSLLLITQIASAANLKTDNDKLSYSLGVYISNNLKDSYDNLDLTLLEQGIKDSMSNSTLKMSSKEMQDAIQLGREQAMEGRQKKLLEDAKVNLTASTTFLQKNKKEKGVKTTEDGLQYRLIKLGKGVKPNINSIVTVDYEGKLIDGSVFDSSYKAGKAATFPLNGVITGWQKGLQLFPVGSKFELFIPPSMAYGVNGIGQIGPNEALIFTIELKDSKQKPQEPTTKK